VVLKEATDQSLNEPVLHNSPAPPLSEVEEDEVTIFTDRAELYRCEQGTGEWVAGDGVIQISRCNNTHQIRLMR